MNDRPPMLIVAVVAVVGFILWRGMGSTPPGERPEGPDLYAVFNEFGQSDEQARSDAIAFGVLCESLGAMIEYDGQRPDGPRLLSGVQLDDLRRWAREYQMRGESFGQRYPSLPKVVGGYLDEQLGTSCGGALDGEMRDKWVASHRQLAKCSLWAAEKLQ